MAGNEVVETPHLIFPLDTTGINTAAMIQHIVYLLISMCKAHPKMDWKELVGLVADGVRRIADSLGLKTKHVFDESIWIPTEPERYGNVVRFYIGFGGRVDYYILEVDLRKGYHDCAALISDRRPEGIPIDPFHVCLKEY